MHVCWPSLASLTPLMSYKKRQQSKSQLPVIACSQTEAPQMPYVLRTAQIQPWTNTTLTQPLTISPHPPSAPTLILVQVKGPSMPLLSWIHSQAQAMDRATALQQIRIGRAKLDPGRKGQGSQLQMKQHMLMQMVERHTWHRLLSKLTSGKCCQTPVNIVCKHNMYIMASRAVQPDHVVMT